MSQQVDWVALRWAHRTRRRAVWMQVKAEQTIRSQLRTMCGWWTGLAKEAGKEEADRRKALADACWTALRKSKPVPADAPETVGRFWAWLEMLAESWDQYQAVRKASEKALAVEARKLPVWPWAEAIVGINAIGLGQILAESGPLDRFPTPEKLRRYLRMCPNGDGEALKRGRAANTVWTALNPLMLQNPDYKGVYDAAKERSQAAEAHAEWTPMHHHLHAHRVMEQRFLDDLWAAWQGQGESQQATAKRT